MTHQHRYGWTSVWCGITVGAHVGVCECGARCEELTAAGMQQLNWWGQLGLDYPEARARILDGDYPWELTPDHRRPTIAAAGRVLGGPRELRRP